MQRINDNFQNLRLKHAHRPKKLKVSKKIKKKKLGYSNYLQSLMKTKSGKNSVNH